MHVWRVLRLRSSRSWRFYLFSFYFVFISSDSCHQRLKWPHSRDKHSENVNCYTNITGLRQLVHICTYSYVCIVQYRIHTYICSLRRKVHKILMSSTEQTNSIEKFTQKNTRFYSCTGIFTYYIHTYCTYILSSSCSFEYYITFMTAITALFRFRCRRHCGTKTMYVHYERCTLFPIITRVAMLWQNVEVFFVNFPSMW